MKSIEESAKEYAAKATLLNNPVLSTSNAFLAGAEAERKRWEGVKEAGWINVTDGLPKIEQDVHLLYEDGKMLTGHRMSLEDIRFYPHRSYSNGPRLKIIPVVKWHPFPEPPKQLNP